MVFFLSVSLLRAQPQDVPAPDGDAILKEIDALEQKQKQGKLTGRNAIIAQIQSAASSGPAAAAFYAQAVEEVRFKGQKGAGGAIAAWKKKDATLLRSKEMQTALLLHLRYLLLSFQRKDLEKPETQASIQAGAGHDRHRAAQPGSGRDVQPGEDKSLAPGF